MSHLKSSFNHFLTIKIGKVIVDQWEENKFLFFLKLKGNPIFQGILKGILHILRYSSQEGTKMFPNH